MPHIIVYGTPDHHGLSQLATRLQDAAAGIEELRISAESVSISMPADRLKDTSVINVQVPNLFSRQDRTADVRNRLGKTLATTIRSWLVDHGITNWEHIHVWLSRLDPEVGYVTLPRDQKES